MPSQWADEGTKAHELCAQALAKDWGKEITPLKQADSEYDEEMKQSAVCYAAFVKEQAGSCDCDVFIEHRVDYSNANRSTGQLWYC